MKNLSIDNMKRFLIIKAILGLEIFFAPIISIFYLRYVHISFEQFAAFEGLTFIIGAFLEIPTGVLSDLIGRKRVFQVGQLIYLFAMALILISPSPTTLFMSAVLFPLGASLSSGNIEAISWELFSSENLQDEYKNLLRRTNWISLIIGSFGAVIGGYLAEKNIVLPFLLDTIALAIVFCAGFVLIPNVNEPASFSLKFVPAKTKMILIEGIDTLIKSKEFTIAVIIFSIFFAVIRGTFLVYQPILSEANVSLPNVGQIIALLGVLSGVCGLIFHRFLAKKHLTYINEMALLFVLGIFSVFGGIILEGFQACIVLIFFQQAVRGIIGPIFGHTLNSFLSPGHPARTSLISIALFATTSLTSLIMWLYGIVNNHFSYLRSTVVLSGSFVGMALVFFILLLKTQKRG